MPTPVTIIGATGLTGSAALSALLSSPSPFSITSLTRRARSASTSPEASKETSYHNRVVDLQSVYTSSTAGESIAQKGGVYISCLGTTRAAVGSVEAQRKVDLDLNTILAERAKADGAETVSFKCRRCFTDTRQFSSPHPEPTHQVGSHTPR